MVIVDSSVLLDFLDGRQNPQTDWLTLHLDMQEIGITSLIQSEVLQGVRNDKRFGEVEEALNQFVIFETASSKLAIAAALNYRRLRSLGITPRNLIDTFLATFCIESGHDLLHRDRDFDGFAAHLGLSVVDFSKFAAN
jgi:predicted nucleic acid-binding protein